MRLSILVISLVVLVSCKTRLANTHYYFPDQYRGSFSINNSPGSTHSDSTYIMGKIIDKSSGEAVPFVNIHFVNKLSEWGTSSDIEGNFEIMCIGETSFLIELYSLGWYPARKNIYLSGGTTIEILVKMEPDTNITFGEDIPIEHIGKIKPTLLHLYLNGIWFYPAKMADNRSASNLYLCDSLRKHYVLNGIELHENDFINIGLKDKDLIGGIGKYRYWHLDGDPSSCIQSMIMTAASTLPIFLNGINVGESLSPIDFRLIDPDNIVSIRRVNPLFRKARIEISTRE